ncbi:MAG: nickel-dependent hydrogenase large subunit [Chromatiaceae bacterium]|nr:nickel-dependent hydrogenase large subunit [Chromatiaceae bacterium]
MAEAGVEGRLLIDLGWRRGRVTGVSVHSTRPLNMPRMFCGKKPAEVTVALPLIYSVCGVAQGCAAAEALEQALGMPVSPAVRHRRRLLIAFETLKEHLWQIELKWTRFLDRAPDRRGITQLFSLMQDFRAAHFPAGRLFAAEDSNVQATPVQFADRLDDLERYLDSRIFSQPRQSWLEICDWQSLSKWSRRCATVAQQMLFQVENRGQAGLGRTRIAALGALDVKYLNRRLAGAGADRFIAQPDWQDAPAETSAFTRHCDHPLLLSLAKEWGNGLLTRAAARLVELALLTDELRNGIVDPGTSDSLESGPCVGPGIGISQVEAARGRLVHRAELAAGRVANYQILAPTEWNFHPKGVLAGSLLGLAAGNTADLQQRAELLINAIDPCVGYQLRIGVSESNGEPGRE